MSENKEVPVFELESAGTSFKDKIKDVFGVLQTLEDKHSAVESARKKTGSGQNDELLWKTDPQDDAETSRKNNERYSHRNKRDNLNRPPERGDNFKKPYIRPASHRKFNRPAIPDFKKNPEKYTCYSLGDVSSSDMTDTSNSRAAFEFLEERRKFREQQERGSDEKEVKVDITDTACSKGVFTFKKRGKKTDPEDENSCKTGKTREITPNNLPELDCEESCEISEVKDNEDETTSFKRRKTKQRSIKVRETDDGQ